MTANARRALHQGPCGADRAADLWAVGTALLSTLAASAASSYVEGRKPTPGLAGAAAVHGYTTAFWVAAGIFAVGAVLAAGLVRGRVPPEVRRDDRGAVAA